MHYHFHKIFAIIIVSLVISLFIFNKIITVTEYKTSSISNDFLIAENKGGGGGGHAGGGGAHPAAGGGGAAHAATAHPANNGAPGEAKATPQSPKPPDNNAAAPNKENQNRAAEVQYKAAEAQNQAAKNQIKAADAQKAAALQQRAEVPVGGYPYYNTNGYSNYNPFNNTETYTPGYNNVCTNPSFWQNNMNYQYCSNPQTTTSHDQGSSSTTTTVTTTPNSVQTTTTKTTGTHQ